MSVFGVKPLFTLRKLAGRDGGGKPGVFAGRNGNSLPKGHSVKSFAMLAVLKKHIISLHLEFPCHWVTVFDGNLDGKIVAVDV